MPQTINSKQQQNAEQTAGSNILLLLLAWHFCHEMNLFVAFAVVAGTVAIAAKMLLTTINFPTASIAPTTTTILASH